MSSLLRSLNLTNITQRNAFLKTQLRFRGEHRVAKGANDVRRGMLFSKISRKLVSAIKSNGGETDPSLNQNLAAALHEAKMAQMPKATVSEAIKRAVSKKDGGQDLTTIRYEGLGPGGVAVIAEALVSNPAKTAAEVKHIFKKASGSMGPVEYLFSKRGTITFSAGSTGHDTDAMTDAAIDLEVEDIASSTDSDKLTVYTSPSTVYSIQSRLSELGYDVLEWSDGFVAGDKLLLNDEDGERFDVFLDNLENQDEVVKVYHNAE